MNKLHGAIVALFILGAVSLASTVFFYSQIDSERQARQAAEKAKTEIQQSLNEKDKILQEKTQNAASLDSQVAELKAEIRTKNQEITKNRTTIAQQELSIKDLTEKNTLLEKEKKELKSRLEYFEGPTQETETSTLAGGKPAFSENSAVNSAADEKTADPSQAVNSQATGKVILVNKEYRFLVVGLGKLDGIKLQDQFDIVRGDQVIGKVAVSKLYESLSSCDIVQEGKEPFKEGDLVRFAAKA